MSYFTTGIQRELRPGQFGYDVFLLMGQSNMVGSSGVATNTLSDYTSPNIMQWGQMESAGQNNTPVLASDPLQHAGPSVGASIGMSFARLYEKTRLGAGRKIMLVPAALGSTGFTGATSGVSIGGATVALNWRAGETGNLLDLAIKRANLAMAYHPTMNPTPTYLGDTPPEASPYNVFKGVLWHQGENDNGLSQELYKSYLQAMVTEVRSRVSGATNSVFVVGYPTKWFFDRYSVNGATLVLTKVGDIAYFGLPNCAFADSLTPYSLGDNLHFNNADYRTYGQRYFSKYLSLVAPKEIPELTDLTAKAMSRFEEGVLVQWESAAPAFNVVVNDSPYFTFNKNVTLPYTLFTPSGTKAITVVPLNVDGVPGAARTVSVTAASVPTPVVTSATASIGNTFAAGVTVNWTKSDTVMTNVAYGAGTSPSMYTTYASGLTGNSTVVGSEVLAPGGVFTFRVTPSSYGVTGANVTTAPVTMPDRPLTEGLILSVPFASGTVPTTDALGSTLTTVGNLSIANVLPRGNVLNFTRSGYMTTSVTLPASYTKSLWVNFKTIADGQNMLSGGMSGTGFFHYMYLTDSAKMTVGHTSLVNFVIDPTSVTVNTWIHFAVTFQNSTKVLALYRNGALVASRAYDLPFTEGLHVNLGIFQNSSTVNGYVDAPMVYNRALSASEVQSLYNAQFVPS